MVAAGASVGYPLGAWIYSKIAGRWRASAVLFTGWGLFGLGLLGLGALPDFRLIGLAGFVQQIGAGLVLTGLVNQCYERFPLKVRALSTGVWMSAFFAGQFASPLAVAALAGMAGGLRPAITLFGLPPLLLALAALGRRPLAAAAPPVADPA
jgi:MFS family permease